MARPNVLPRSIRQSVQKQSRNLLETGQRFKRFDQLRQRHFWSTLRISPDADGYISSGTRQLFITPPGQVGQGFLTPLTERDTNWKSANRVPDNQNFEVTELGVSVGFVNVQEQFPTVEEPNAFTVVPGALTNATWYAKNQALFNSVVEITYLTNSVPLGLMGDFAQASGPSHPAGGIFGAGTNGFAAPSLRRRFKIPILLQHGETFSFSINTPRAWSTYLNIFPDIVENIQLEYRFDFWATESFVEKS